MIGWEEWEAVLAIGSIEQKLSDHVGAQQQKLNPNPFPLFSSTVYV